MSARGLILGVYPEVIRNGGVQRLSRHVALVLNRLGRKLGRPVRHLSLLDPMETVLEVGGERLPITGFSGNRNDLTSTCWRLAAKTDLVYTTHVYQAPLSLMMRIKRPRLSLAVHLHGIEVWQPLQLVRQGALATASLTTLTSADTGEQAVRHQHLPVPNRKVLYPALDPGFEFTETPPAGNRPPHFLTVARLDTNDRAKGIDLSIGAFADIAADFPDAVYTIVGEGSDRERLEEIAQRHALTDRIRFTGKVSDEDLIRLYSEARAFVLPSGKEGFGIVFLEAFAAAMPCIGGNAGGSPEIVLHEKTGFTVTPGNRVEIAAAMRRLLQDPNLATTLGEEGRRHVLKEHLFARFEERLSGYLEPLLP